MQNRWSLLGSERCPKSLQLALFEDLAQVRQVGHLIKGQFLGAGFGCIQNLQEKIRREVTDRSAITASNELGP